MKRDVLPTRWVRWRRRRYQALAAQGVESDEAWNFADVEARARRRISNVVGYVAARDADLIKIGDRFAVMGDFASLTDGQRAAVEAESTQATPATA